MQALLVEAITNLAAVQHGLIAANQLAHLGVSESQLRTLRRQAWLDVEAPRVFAVAGAPPSIECRLRAGLLCLGRHALVSHEAAGRLHGFDRCRSDAVEFTLPRSSRGRAVPFVVHTTNDLPPLDRVTVGGFACTSAARTIIDLARARVTTVRLEAAIDSAVRSGASAPLVLARRLDELRGPGRWGAPRLDRLLVDSGGHTILERRFLTSCAAPACPDPPRRSSTVATAGPTPGSTSASMTTIVVVVEVSGQRGHASPGERARDAQRRNELQDIGRRVFEYTWRDVTERPWFVARDDAGTARPALTHAWSENPSWR
jgi:hypothetical protein